MLCRFISILIYIITLLSHASAEVYVTTLAGSGTSGSADGTGTAASFYSPTGLHMTSSGVLYVADRGNHRLRKVTSAGVVSTYAGGGSTTVKDSGGAAASFNQPNGVVFDAFGNLYVADTFNQMIRQITPLNVISTFAGSGASGSADGTGTGATFYYPNGVAVDSSGNLYVADWNSNKLRKVTSSGVVTTLAGNGTGSYADGTGTNAMFYNPAAAAVDSSGNIFVCDCTNHLIRKVTSAGVVTTFAGSTAGYADGIGTAAQFNQPSGIAIDSSNNLYIADGGNNRVRMITPTGEVTTIAGSGIYGYANGDPLSAMFKFPYGIALDYLGNIYVSEKNGNRIRVINMGNTPPTTTTTTAATTTATADVPIYTSSPTKLGDTNFTTTLAISIVIPIALLVICASTIFIYMRYKRIGVTWVWMRGCPKLVVVDKKQKNATPTHDKLIR